MGRHSFVRRYRTAARVGIAAGTALVLGSTVLGMGALGASAAEVQPTALTIPAPQEVAPDAGKLLGAGPTGVLRGSYQGGFEWIRYADGARTAVDQVTGEQVTGTGTDAVARISGSTTDGQRVRLTDLSTGDDHTVQLPARHVAWALIGDTVITRFYVTGAPYSFHLFTYEDGKTVERPVTGLPEGATLNNVARLPRPSASGILGTYDSAGVKKYVWIEPDGTTRPYDPTASYTGEGDSTKSLVISDDRIVVWTANGRVTVWDTDDLTTPVSRLDLPYPENGKALGLAGDHLLFAVPRAGVGGIDFDDANNWVTKTVPLAGGEPRTLIERSTATAVQAPDGRLLIVRGGEGAERTLTSVRAGADGVVQTDDVAAVTPFVVKSSRVALDRGQLVTVDKTPWNAYQLQTTQLTVSGPPAAGTREDLGVYAAGVSDGCDVHDCPQPLPTGDGRLVTGRWSDTYSRDVLAVIGPDDPLPGREINTSLNAQTYPKVSGRYAARSGRASATDQTPAIEVVDLDTGKAVLSRKLPAYRSFALDGSTLWLEGSSAGVIDAVDVRTGNTKSSVDVGSCDIGELQAVGRYLLWGCNANGTASVYNTAAKRNVPLPAHVYAALADGYVATSDRSTLTLTDVRGATPAVLGKVTGLERGTPGYDWAVDTHGGSLVYAEADGDLQVLPAPVPASALSVLDSATPSSVDAKGGSGQWAARWWPSRPVLSWRLTVKDKATGRTVRTLTGGEARGIIRAAWDGKDSAGRLVPNGAYTWTLTAPPADGSGAALTATGTIGLTGGEAVRRDHAGTGGPDGFGDLLTLNSSGSFTFQRGTGTGSFSGKTSGGVWSASTLAIPFGDLNGDRCNDVLVRMPDGRMRAYTPACGAALTPTTAHKVLGTGWNMHNVLTAAGDLTGDGRTDLVARKASTGELFVYRGSASGTVGSPIRVGSGWGAYTKIVGVGDLNGDGHGELLARASNGTLYRYDGVGNGLFKSRVTLATGWGSSYNALVGVGDITGDGKADLVARDTSGNLYRWSGYGNGKFTGRVKIATGWSVYKGLF